MFIDFEDEQPWLGLGFLFADAGLFAVDTIPPEILRMLCAAITITPRLNGTPSLSPVLTGTPSIERC